MPQADRIEAVVALEQAAGRIHLPGPLRSVGDDAPELPRGVIAVGLGPNLPLRKRVIRLGERDQPEIYRVASGRGDQLGRGRVVRGDHRLAERHRLGQQQAQPLASVQRQDRVHRHHQAQYLLAWEGRLDQVGVARAVERLAERAGGVRSLVGVQCLNHQSDPAIAAASGTEGPPKRLDRAERVLALQEGEVVEGKEEQEGVAREVVAVARDGFDGLRAQRQRHMDHRLAGQLAHDGPLDEAGRRPDLVRQLNGRQPRVGEAGELPERRDDPVGVAAQRRAEMVEHDAELVGIDVKELNPAAAARHQELAHAVLDVGGRMQVDIEPFGRDAVVDQRAQREPACLAHARGGPQVADDREGRLLGRARGGRPSRPLGPAGADGDRLGQTLIPEPLAGVIDEPSRICLDASRGGGVEGDLQTGVLLAQVAHQVGD